MVMTMVNLHFHASVCKSCGIVCLSASWAIDNDNHNDKITITVMTMKMSMMTKMTWQYVVNLILWVNFLEHDNENVNDDKDDMTICRQYVVNLILWVNFLEHYNWLPPEKIWIIMVVLLRRSKINQPCVLENLDNYVDKSW